MIRVLYYAGVRDKTGTNETRVEGFSHAGTIAGLVRHLEERHGIYLLNSSSSQVEHAKNAKNTDLLSALIIMVNGRHIAHVGGLDAPVSEGDIVSIFPLIGGG